MNLHRFRLSMIVVCAALSLFEGCKNIPGKPGPEAARPSEVMNFPVLYKQNCAACHGENGKGGAAISLGNPVYLKVAGVDKIQQITSSGLAGTLMPPFAKSQGGMLTDQQIRALAQGIISAWGNGDSLTGKNTPAYAASSPGNVAHGEKVFGPYCASCHGADGTGIQNGKSRSGSIVDPSYLALISDQGLRSLIIAGQPEQGMPNWMSDASGTRAPALTDQDITDIVAWLGSHRISAPGQPYEKATD